MIEATLERLFVKRFEKVLEGLGVQVVGTLQPAMQDMVKGEEEGGMGVLVVKVQPRSYDTPTIPTCRINCALSLSLRADLDYNGKTYFDVCSMLVNEMERLQKCLSDVHREFAIPDEGFTPTGFQLGEGDTGVNVQSKVFSYTHTFTVFGVIDAHLWETPNGACLSCL